MIRRRHIASSALAMSLLAVAGLAVPSAAQDTSTITVTINGGSLVIDAPDTVSGSGGVNSLVTVDVADVSVDDDRGSLLGWTATASSTDLTTGGGDEVGETILAATLTWTTSAVNPLEGQDAIAAPGAGNLGVATPIAVGAPVLSPGAFDIDGEISVPVPLNARAGEYTGTLTTTVS